MRHTINEQDLSGHTQQIELAGSYGQGIADYRRSCKTLAAEVVITKTAPKVQYVVLEEHKPILKTKSLRKAVKKYNELP